VEKSTNFDVSRDSFYHLSKILNLTEFQFVIFDMKPASIDTRHPNYPLILCF
jgi:hypothetical protein